jgi:acyl transferase domain-containing protein/acyl carrier protein
MTDTTLNQEERTGLEIAVIGMSGRFPGADSIDEFWNLLRDGKEGITYFTPEQLKEAGVPQHVMNDPNFVNALFMVDNCHDFDPRFFGYTPKEAELMDPQVRLFHECVWEALEQAGYDPYAYEGLIGLYAGASGNLYWETLVMQSPERQELGDFAAAQLSDKDYLCTRISFKFNLRGPSYTIQTACSTSLVAIHVACQALLNGECDMALAGGSKISAFGNTGYLYQEGMIFSPDGHCRPFDADSKGTVGGNGAAVVLLKPLEEALADRDYIYAVVKGTAVNNDGSQKAGYTAPAPEGQCAAIKVACQVAEVEPDTISYIETHGTGTDLGDPIEVEALVRAFDSEKRGFCGIGSVKSNLGHLDSAAGAAGFIKTALALHHQFIPPTLHFKAPNPRIDFENSPFYVVDKPTPWNPPAGVPLRAGVSSFGIGGTNAHVVMEEAPADESPQSGPSHRNLFLLPLSGRTANALDAASDNMHSFFKKNPSLPIADTAFTLQVGRRHFQHRQAIVSDTIDDACNRLDAAAPSSGIRYNAGDTERPVVFLFPGAGTQYTDMGIGLYNTEPVFRRHMDHCLDLLKSRLGYDLKELLYPGECSGPATVDSSFHIDDTGVAQPLLFAFEYSLARMLMDWGVKPYAMMGHSLGEYVAASLSGVITLEEGIHMVALRARLMQAMPGGAMLGVPLTEEKILSILPADLDLSLVNAPQSCVVGGPKEAVERFARILEAGGVEPRRLHSSHAAHSRMMEPMLADFRAGLAQVDFQRPQIPYVSNLTGTWITVAEAENSDYWLKHLRQPVRFADGLNPVLEIENAVLVEVGPGRILTSFAKQHPAMTKDRLSTDLVRHPKKEAADDRFFLERLATLWTWGVSIDWSAYTGDQEFRRIPLPTYPFQRQTYKLDDKALKEGKINTAAMSAGVGSQDPADWFYLPSWQRSKSPLLDEERLKNRGPWWIFLGRTGVGESLASKLEDLNISVVRIPFGEAFKIEGKPLPGSIVYCRAIGGQTADALDNDVENNFHTIIDLVRELGNCERQDPIHLSIVTANGQEVTGGDLSDPRQALVAGAVRVVPLEYPHIRCRWIDIDGSGDPILAELSAETDEPLVAYRANRRWIHTFQPTSFEAAAGESPRLKKNGVYLLPGGMGGVGQQLAHYLAETLNANLILTRRGEGGDPLPEIRSHAKDVMVESMDIADPAQVERLVDKVIDRYGRIDGILHLAGAPDGAVIHRRTREMSDTVMDPKVKGILAFDRVLTERGIAPDFVVYFSSLASHLPGFGQAAHCAANAFLDAFALYKSNGGNTFHLSIDWNSWREVGQAAEAARKAAARVDVALENGVTVQEGIDIFRRALGADEPHIAISSIDIREMESRLRHAADEESGIMQTLREETVDTAASYDRPELSNEYMEPDTPLQRTLADIWRNYFGFRKIGVDDDFFELGGDSLRAINFLSRLHKEFQVKIPLAAFFNHPTIRELAVYIQDAMAETYETIQPVDKQDDYPLSSAQSRLYFLQRFEPSATGYNETQLVELEGPVDVERLESAFKGLIQRHESLRTSMTMKGDQPVQRVHDAAEVKFHLEVREAAEDAIESEMEDFVRPFDLEVPVYLRGRLLKLSPQRHILMMDMHHLVTDDVSDKVFVREFTQLYKGESLESLKLQYRDFACWQRDRAGSGVMEAQREYWQRQLTGPLQSLDFPTDFPRPKVRDYRGVSIPFVIEREQAAAIKRLASNTGSTLFMTLLAAYNVLLAKFTGAGEILVGTPVAGRLQEELNSVVGMFVNTLVIRSQPDGAKTFLQFLEEVRETALAAFQHQDVPFEEIVADLGVERNQQGNLLFDTMFNMLDRDTDTLTIGELTFKPYRLPWVTAKYDFKMEAYELEGEIHVRLNYCRSLFKSETMERMADSMKRILETIGREPSILISAIDMSDGASQQIMDDFNDDLEEME